MEKVRENARRADMSADAGPAPVVTAVVYQAKLRSRLRADGQRGRAYTRAVSGDRGRHREGQAPGGSSPAREVVITAHAGLPWSNARMQLRMFP